MTPSSTTIRKAVVPMAGLGTRFRPVSYAVPKEFLPIINRPLIDYIIDEIKDAGCDELVCVLMPGRDFVTPYLQQVGTDLRLTVCFQHEAKGLGHAIACAESAVGNEPFFVLLPDVLVEAPMGVCRQMAQAYTAHESTSVIAVRREPKEKLSSYGVVAVDARHSEHVFTIADLVEKPQPADAPSDLAIVGRYVLLPSVFTHLRNAKPGAKGEIQLTDALVQIAQSETMLGMIQTETAMFDAGQPAGWLAANIYYGTKAGLV